MKNLLPLYHVKAPTLCSRTAQFLTGLLFFCSLFVLALEVPSLLYYFFYFINFLFTFFYQARDFYRSETGQTIFKCTKLLFFIYSEISSIKDLKKQMERGDIMVPPLFIWIFQDYKEEASNFFSRINPILLNKLYDKISDDLLDSVCTTSNFF